MTEMTIMHTMILKSWRRCPIDSDDSCDFFSNQFYLCRQFTIFLISFRCLGYHLSVHYHYNKPRHNLQILQTSMKSDPHTVPPQSQNRASQKTDKSKVMLRLEFFFNLDFVPPLIYKRTEDECRLRNIAREQRR